MHFFVCDRDWLRSFATQSIFASFVLSSTVLSGAAAVRSAELPPVVSPVPADGLDAMTADPMGKVTKVAELTDVKSTDWAFQAVQSLVERYGVLSGYPDKTFRGDRNLTRNEFAAALSKALPSLDLSQFATKEDLANLQKLLDEFKVELANAEAEFDRVQRTINQFSTTTKLEGQAIFALTGVANARKADDDETTDSNLAFGNRISLEFNTSFVGKDLLKTTLKTGNIRSLDRATDTNMARLSFQNDEDNEIVLDELFYRRRFGKQLNVNLVAVGGSLNKFAETFNPFAESSGDGVISRFAQRNPIYRQGGGAGLGLSYDVTDTITLSAGYLADDADQVKSGLFGGAHAAIAQLTVDLGKTAGFGLSYIRSYNSLDTATGSERANDPFRNRSNNITADSWGLQGAIGLGRKLALSGWVGFTRAAAKDLPNNPTANIVNWAAMLSFPDLGKEGNLGGIVFGQPPKVTNNEFIFRRQNYTDRDTTFHLEAFYRHRVNDFISITPGLLVLFNPEHNRNNDTLYIGTIRTTFSF
jgi:Carbohydrate-selective porin, OprB family/S-layer homology domain